MAVPISEDGGGYHYRDHAPEPPRSSGLTTIFRAVAGVAAAVAAIIGIGYAAPEAVNLFLRTPEEIQVGATLGATVGVIGGYMKAMDRWGAGMGEDLLTVAFGAVAGGVVGGLLGAGWHLNNAVTHVASSVTSGAREMAASIASLPQRFL